MKRRGYILKNRFYRFLISATDLIGGIVFLPFKIFRRRAPGNVSNILVIRMDHIGDLICSLPVIQNLKEHYKGAKITLLVASWTKEMVINNPYADEVICYDAPWFNRKGKKVFEFGRFLMLAGELRRHRYDLGFDLRGDLRHILLMALAGVKFRVGYGITGGGFLLHKKPAYREGVHTIEHNLDLLRSLGVNIIDSQPRLYSSTEEEEYINNILQESGISESDFIVTIHPHAGYSSKRWMDKRFAELIEVLLKEFSAKIILTGAKENKEKNDNIARQACLPTGQAGLPTGQAGLPAVNLAGRTSLGSLFALLKKSDLFIGVDSGPSHVAASAGIPAVILYSGTNSVAEWGPLSDKAVVIQKDIHCKECHKIDCRDNICMDLISIEDVMEAIRRVTI